MAGAPLSAAQQAAVGELVAGGRLEVVPVDEARAGAFLLQASEALADLPNVTRSQNRYTLAYDACHDVGDRRSRASVPDPDAVTVMLRALAGRDIAALSFRHDGDPHRRCAAEAPAGCRVVAASACPAFRRAAAEHRRV